MRFEQPGTIVVAIPFPAPLLVPGQYTVTPCVAREGHGAVNAQMEAISFEIVDVKGVQSARAGYV